MTTSAAAALLHRRFARPPAYSDDAARVFQPSSAHRSNLMPPAIPIRSRPGWGRLAGLFYELQKELGLTYLFVSHDLAVVRQISDTVSVLHNGKQADHGSVGKVFHDTASDYTRELIAAIPGKRRRDAELPANPNEKVQSQ